MFCLQIVDLLNSLSWLLFLICSHTAVTSCPPWLHPWVVVSSSPTGSALEEIFIVTSSLQPLLSSPLQSWTTATCYTNLINYCLCLCLSLTCQSPLVMKSLDEPTGRPGRAEEEKTNEQTKESRKKSIENSTTKLKVTKIKGPAECFIYWRWVEHLLTSSLSVAEQHQRYIPTRCLVHQFILQKLDDMSFSLS